MFGFHGSYTQTCSARLQMADKGVFR